MQKQKLLIVIDNLRKGGAEVLLVGILPSLNNHFEVILATLSGECDFPAEEIICKRKYNLGFRNKYSLWRSVKRLKKIIGKEQPAFIHSHLFYSSLIARLASSKTIPVLYSLHNEMSQNVFDNSKILRILEKKTTRPNHLPIAVSHYVLEDYEKMFGKQKKAFVLPNYISDQFFASGIREHKMPKGKQLKLVAVGNVKKQKNYLYLVRAFETLQGYPVTLDIFGDGSKREVERLQTEIDKRNLRVFLKGPADNLPQILPDYDLFVSSSSYEGFGIAVAEAMAVGLPLLLSDITVFHEVSFDNAIFFDVNNPANFTRVIDAIFENKYDLSELSRNGIENSKMYSKEIYLEKIFKIYGSVSQHRPVKSEFVNA